MSATVRERASLALAISGAVLLLAGAVLLYAREQIVDSQSFADKAEVALEDDRVRDVVAREIVVNLLENGSANLVAGRPVLETVVGTVIDSKPFQRLFREAALQANLLFFDRRQDNLAFDLANASKIVRFGLKSVDPRLAAQVPKDLDVTLLDLENRRFAQNTLEAADEIRLAGIVVPLLALLLLAGAVFLAANRRVGLLRVAVGVGAAGILLALALLIFRHVIINGSYGSDELTDEDVRAAVAGILDAFFGPLFGWALVLAFSGIVVSGAAVALDPEDVQSPSKRLRERLTPTTTAGRVGRAVAAIVAGLLVAFDTGLALQLAGLLAGGYLVFFGTSELLVMLEGPEAAKPDARARRRRTLWIASGAATVVVLAVLGGLALSLDSGEDPDALPVPKSGCNGSVALCSVPVNEALFPGTHNSFSAADSEGWLIANQRRNIETQLADGVRLFLIDPHWGVADEQGRVRTDFEAEGRDRNRVAKSLPPDVLEAAEGLTDSIGLRENEGGERQIFLCHTTCELGATSMSDTLGVYRSFLERNPGEVLVLFLEPYVPPPVIEDAFADAGLDRYAATLRLRGPQPTLGQLVADDRRLIVFTEHDGGDPAWLMEGFDYVQDTPLGVTRVQDASCDLNRGKPDSPFLMINGWADVFPPQRSANAAFQRKRFLLERIRRCSARRGRPVSLLAVDHYDQGSLIAVANRVNARRAAK